MKDIYISKILDDLLGGIDTAIENMKEAINKMLGGDLPQDQKSLADVVSTLNNVVGDDNKSLSNVVTELQNNSAAIIGSGNKSLSDVVSQLAFVATTIEHNAPGINIKSSNPNVEKILLDKTGADIRQNITQYYIIGATGTLNFNINLNINYGGESGDIVYLKRNEDIIYTKNLASPIQSTVETAKVFVKPGDKLEFRYYSRASLAIPGTLKARFSLSYSLGISAAQDDIIMATPL